MVLEGVVLLVVVVVEEELLVVVLVVCVLLLDTALPVILALLPGLSISPIWWTMRSIATARNIYKIKENKQKTKRFTEQTTTNSNFIYKTWNLFLKYQK